MRIGVIAEGHSDRAVIISILNGITGLEEDDIIPILPINASDETDKAIKKKEEFGGWTSVINECKKREFIDDFLLLDGNDFIVIHIDTAELEQYGVGRPDKRNVDYSLNLRQILIKQINAWLQIDLQDSLLYAIAIEEIEAWILTIYETGISSKFNNPKRRLEYTLGLKEGKLKPNYELYSQLSKAFAKNEKNIKKAGYLERNYSLKSFYEEVSLKVLDKLNS